MRHLKYLVALEHTDNIEHYKDEIGNQLAGTRNIDRTLDPTSAWLNAWHLGTTKC